MIDSSKAKVAIVDYGLGNLFSVKQAWKHAGVGAAITESLHELLSADAVVLPGVGAFGDAMESLKRLDLVSPIRDIAASGKILIGVCLGLQLLMTESFEFGRHQGLGIIEGPVVRFDHPVEALDDSNGPTFRELKVPQVGWNRIFRCGGRDRSTDPAIPRLNPWSSSPLAGLDDEEFMYFNHSYYPKPEDPDTVLSESHYGNIAFCSSLRYQNVFACQFHPERSGPLGLRVYKNLVNWITGPA